MIAVDLVGCRTRRSATPHRRARARRRIAAVRRRRSAGRHRSSPSPSSSPAPSHPPGVPVRLRGRHRTPRSLQAGRDDDCPSATWARSSPRTLVGSFIARPDRRRVPRLARYRAASHARVHARTPVARARDCRESHRRTAIVSTRSFRQARSPCARRSRASCGRSCRAARRQTGGRGGCRHADAPCNGTSARPDPPRCCPGVTAISCRRLFSNASRRSSPRPHGWMNDDDALPSGAA